MTEYTQQDAREEEAVAAKPKSTVEHVEDILGRRRDKFAEVLKPYGMSADRFISICISDLRQNVKIHNLDPVQIATCYYRCAQHGLEPGREKGLIYVSPGRGGVGITVGYRGFVEVLYRTGKVAAINAEVVYEGDRFEVILGTSPQIIHGPSYTPGRQKRKEIATYCVVHLKDSPIPTSAVLSHEEVEHIRMHANSGGGGPWVTNRGEMVKKTAIRRVQKLLPQLSHEVAELEKLDNEDYDWGRRKEVPLKPRALLEIEAMAEAPEGPKDRAVRDRCADLLAGAENAGLEVPEIDPMSAPLDEVKFVVERLSSALR